MCVSFFSCSVYTFHVLETLFRGRRDQMIALFVSNQYERYGFMEGGLASFFSSHKFLIFQKTKRKGRSRRRRLPAVSRFYRAHRMSPPLGAAGFPIKGRAAVSARRRKAPCHLPQFHSSLLSSSLKVRALASRRSFVRAKREKTTLFDEGQ